VIRLNEIAHELVADHFFIVPAGRTHSYHSEEKDPWSIYWIHFSGSKSSIFNRYAGEAIAIERVASSRISDRIDLFSEIFRNLDRGFSVETLEYVNLCLPHLLASFTHLSQFQLVREPGENDPVGLGINFMLEHLSGKIKLQEIAEVSGLSASHFSRLFLNSTGHSPIDYYIQLKVQRACRLLDHPGSMVAAVSREMGFEDQFYFSRVFRKVMGISPTVYRKRGVYNEKM
jgi:AraC family transcriptional regulator of arabinose operon